jgi:hypothetical protein
VTVDVRALVDSRRATVELDAVAASALSDGLLDLLEQLSRGVPRQEAYASAWANIERRMGWSPVRPVAAWHGARAVAASRACP